MVNILVVLCLLFIAWQDFKYRAISWYTLPVLAILFTVKVIYDNGLMEWWGFLKMNIAMLVILICGIILYTFLKYRRFKNPFDTLIGWGDVLFMLVLCFGMYYINFLLFITVSCVLLLLGVLVLMLFRKSKEPVLIPLAGFQAICFVFVLGVEVYSGNQIFDNQNILSL